MDEIRPCQPNTAHQSGAHTESLDQRDRHGKAEEGQPEQPWKNEERCEERKRNEDQHPDRVRHDRVPASQRRLCHERAGDDIAERDQERAGRGRDDLP